jgi:hypothetical protein
MMRVLDSRRRREDSMLFSLATLLVAAAVLFGGLVALTPLVVDITLLAMALSGAHAVVALAGGS